MEEMRKETVDIIRDITNDLDKTIIVKNIVDNNDGTYIVYTCNTLYAQVCKELKIENRKYLITNVEHNKSITLKGNVLPSVNSFELYPISYFHGKAIDTNAELDMIDDKDTITPLIYLTEIYTDRFYDNDELVERTVDLRMFFLTTANYEDWKTIDHYKGSILPMRNLSYNFIEKLKNSKIIGKFVNYYDLTNHAKFGIFILRKGAIKRIFDDNYSGVEFNIRLSILKDMSNDGCCN